MILRTPKSSSQGITSTQGTTGIRAALRNRTAAMGVATVLAAAPALAQDATTAQPEPVPTLQDPAAPATPLEASTDESSAPAEAVAAPVAAEPAPAPAPVAAPAPVTTPAPVAAEAPAPQPEGDELESYTLPTVQVEGTESHPTSSGLTRLPTKLVDTPQTVVVVPEVMLKEQRAVSVADALRNVSGVTANAGEGGRQGDAFLIRGFSAQNDIFRDGGRDNGWYTRDTFNLENVEVFFGPSAVLFGRGSTGGAINLVTKKPKANNFNSVVLSAGTSPSGRAELDMNRVVDERVQVRLNVAGQLAATAGRDLTRQDRLGIAPSIGIQLTDTARLEVDYLYQHEDGVPDYGQPLYDHQPVGVSLDVPREAHYGVRGSDTELVDANILTARLLQELGQKSALTNTLRLARVERFARPTAPRGVSVPTDGSAATVGRQRFETETDNDYLFDQLDLRFAFATGPIEHALNVGAEASFEHRQQQRHNLRGPGNANTPADLLDPNPSPDITDVNRVFASASDTRQTTAGVYLADQLKITKYFELLGSARFDWFQTRYTTFGADPVSTPGAFQQTDRMFNWRVGAVAHPVKNVSVYAMYGTSSNPSAELGALSNGTLTVDPERNTNLEFGAKAELLEGKLGLAASAFRIDKENGRLADPDPTAIRQVTDGLQRVEGLNLNVSGEITSVWKVFGNYTFLQSRTGRQQDGFSPGSRVPATPKHSASLWTTVEVIPRLTLGAGATGRSEMAVNDPVPPAPAPPVQANVLPGYVRFDAYAAYAFQAFDLQLNVNNLGNGHFYETGYSGHALPAAGRSAMLTARFDF